MGTVILNEMKKRASGFLHEKYNTARLVLTDITPAELLAEETTNNEPCSPDAKTMTKIAQASFDIDDYWRIVDVLHARFYNLDWKEWRQSYKALVLLEFLLTHGPEDFREEFHCDIDVIQELATFKYIDQRGFDWGASMQKKSERILKLLNGGEFFKEARLKAIRVTREIKGFGNYETSPSSSSTPSSSSSSSSAGSKASFGTFSPNSSPSSSKSEYYSQDESSPGKLSSPEIKARVRHAHIWDSPVEETGSLLDGGEGKKEVKEKSNGFMDGIRSKLANVTSPSKLKSFSGLGMVAKKTFDRQFSMGY